MTDLAAVLEGTEFHSPENVQQVSGGDINAAFSFTKYSSKYFIKLNDAGSYPGLFEKEANGLKEIARNSSFRIPEIHSTGKNDKFQYLIMEFLQEGKAKTNSWADFALHLAAMHRVEGDQFGFVEDNYLGTQVQDNTKKSSWAQFYAENRLLPSMKQMYDKGVADLKDLNLLENICNKLDDIYPLENSSLLHGDLWNGNYHILSDGHITVIDPAVYYGHREMDLAMCMLFGGFPDEFYQTYFADFPLEAGFSERVEVSQLYYLIFHAIRFGGSYISHVGRILKKFG